MVVHLLVQNTVTNSTYFHGVNILWKGTVSAEFRANRPKLCGNCFSTKFIYREIRWNYGILRSAICQSSIIKILHNWQTLKFVWSGNMMYFGENESFFHNIQHSKSRLLPFKVRAFIVIESVTLTDIMYRVNNNSKVYWIFEQKNSLFL